MNSKGTFSISVVPEDKKEKLAKIWNNFDCWLYSIETKSNSKSLDLPVNFEPIHVKNLQVNIGTRDLGVPVKQEPSTSQIDTTKIKTPFGMVKPLEKKEIKKEKTDEIIKTEEETVKVKIVDPIKEELPQKVSPESKASKVKPNAKKNGKNQPVSQGKGSISSFFGKPSNKSSTDNRSTAISEPTLIKKDPEIKVEEKKEEVPRKRSASPDILKKEPVKKVPSKKLKLKVPPNKKRSRIQVMEDSSEEEEVEPQIEDLPDSKFIKFDREMTPEKQMCSPEKMEVEEKVEEPKNDDLKPGHRNKAKRWVTKRFETDDGFIRTEKVLEEYSDDENENENEDNIKKNSQSQEKIESPSKKTPQKKVTPKTKVKDMPKTKQGSIMNFFNKK
ncbi:hypothetical protein ACKWTF_002000 [Chironomus riparius]